jgi:hypothetical protein
MTAKQANEIVNIEFDCRLRIPNAIDRATLTFEYGGDVLAYTKELIDSEGMLGCVEVVDSSTVIAAREYSDAS